MTTQATTTQWEYLEKRHHPWRQQLYLTGRKLRAFTVWMDMIVNDLTPEEVAENKDLPLAAVKEAIEYCESHQDLLAQEAQRERFYLEKKEFPLSLRLLIDEDTQDRLLVKLLREAEHDVITANEAKLSRQPDEIVLNYARDNQRVLLTRNCSDFENLHFSSATHSGILAIYRDNNPSKNMSFKAIIKAIANIEEATLPLTHQFIILNHWNY